MKGGGEGAGVVIGGGGVEESLQYLHRITYNVNRKSMHLLSILIELFSKLSFNSI